VFVQAARVAGGRHETRWREPRQVAVTAGRQARRQAAQRVVVRHSTYAGRQAVAGGTLVR